MRVDEELTPTIPGRWGEEVFPLLSWFRLDKVRNANVMVVGCGALGNEVLKNLALFGVEHLVIVDFDTIELSNLTRSILFTPEDAGAVIDGCGMDGVMFARGAIGNPFIFRMAKEYMASGSFALPSAEEKVMTALSHLRLAIDAYGEAVACREMRKQLMAYIKGISGASSVKARLTQASTEEECVNALMLLVK